MISNLIVNNPITLGYTIPPTKGQIGYVQTNSFSTLYVPTNDTLNCYAPIQYTNLPAGLYAINYYCTGINYWGAIALVSSTITTETTVPKECNYGVSNGTGTLSNSAIIRLDGSTGIAIGYLSTDTSTISGSIQATRIA
jgi:hypothetical protein